MVTTISTTPQHSSEEKLITLTGIKWQTFKAIMSDVGDGRAWRIAYDAGVLEIRMPLPKHERPKVMLEQFIGALADELEIEAMSLGALTLEREDLTRAIEPDTCFYIQNELVDGNYEPKENSLAFPFLPIAQIPGFIEQSKSIGQRAAVRLFREMVRGVLS
jgi:Uma2 family endonuclease